MTQSEPEPLPITFRPSAAMRSISCGIGILSLIATSKQVMVTIQSVTNAHLLAIVVMAFPAIFATILNTRYIRLTEDCIEDQRFMSRRNVEWREVLKLDQTRKSFVIVTTKGEISAGWISPERRDLLFRKILEKAKLVMSPSPTKWGVRAAFVPRAVPIRLELTKPTTIVPPNGKS